jgi:hypothetical protein
MQSFPTRLAELDFFRGLVLLIIVVDHIGGSMLSRVTLHSFAACDAAEVFVFLGGYAAATAWLSLAQRGTEHDARKRFIKRAWEIYRAFLVTAALMLLTSAVMRAHGIDAPNLDVADLDDLREAPVQVLGDILLFRRQPYLAAVLPMYALFALAMPLIMPLAQRKPWHVVAASVALWAVAPEAYGVLPRAPDSEWDFNPFAWQLLFVVGAVARCQPFYQRVTRHRLGWTVSLLALVIAIAAACYKLFVETDLPGGEMKQHLGSLRVINFAALAWLGADTVRFGWSRWLANRAPAICAVGRKGLLCFIAGAVISLVLDSVLYAMTDGYIDVPRGFAADAIAIGSLLLIAKMSGPLTRALTFKMS